MFRISAEILLENNDGRQTQSQLRLKNYFPGHEWAVTEAFPRLRNRIASPLVRAPDKEEMSSNPRQDKT